MMEELDNNLTTDSLDIDFESFVPASLSGYEMIVIHKSFKFNDKIDVTG